MRILLLNQAFYPDVVSTAQHLADLAQALAQDGHQVTVICSSRAYDQPQVRFRRRESWNGIEIIRLPCSGFGKRARWRRALDFATFSFSCSIQLLFLCRFDVVVALTSPPLISVLGAVFVRIKGGKLVFWAMDLNPDEAIAAGWLRRGSLPERILSALLRFSLHVSRHIVALDCFMKQRLMAKGISADRISVIPPWPHDDAVVFDPEGRARFRSFHGWDGKYVVMYSGNHSPCHPLDTLLYAARELAADKRIVFCFVGGGSEFEKVRRFAAEHRLTNIVQLPYQPLPELPASLSAADLQVVVMGDAFAGIVHPCKIYNLLSIGSPLLYIGPEVSHISAILETLDLSNAARSARHGAVHDVIQCILDGAAGRLHSHTYAGLNPQFSREVLLPRFLFTVEAVHEGFSTSFTPAGEWSDILRETMSGSVELVHSTARAKAASASK